jgi:5-(carboxyamino)imidazole ribonucleotide synthase
VPDSDEPARNRTGPIGIVGAGQLARMLCEAASALAWPTVVLAERPDDASIPVASQVLLGRATSFEDLSRLAERCSAVTFDHELVDLDALRKLQGEGAHLAPGPDTLELTVDKAHMRGRLAGAGIPVPAFQGLAPGTEGTPGWRGAALESVSAFAAVHDWPLVLKATRGGYDGRGVWVVHDEDEARSVVASAAEHRTPLLVEECVRIECELAALVARRPSGDMVAWPAVETLQVGGVCRQVSLPGRLPPDVASAARQLGMEVATLAGAVGVLAVEMFWDGERLVVNELAARPHNSGHWTMEGARTSQFENHLRAVLDLPLGATDATAPWVVNVNVFGDEQGGDPGGRLAGALAVDGAHVHLYGKAPRPGRKLGHVTVLGSDPGTTRRRAWQAARALGTPVPGSLAGLAS